MKPEQHRRLQQWGEQLCADCGHDRAAHIEPRKEGVCADFAPDAEPAADD